MTNTEIMELESVVSAVVRRTIEEKLEMYEEVWLTADQMQKHFGTMKKSWLDRYGHSLPFRKQKVEDEDGVEHESSRVYPLHKIQRMFANGEIEHLKCKAIIS